LIWTILQKSQHDLHLGKLCIH